MGFVQYDKGQQLPLSVETICTISLQQLKRSEQLHFGRKIASSGKHPYKADTAAPKTVWEQ
jgi:hypothetical protein